jgi:hypothetical protein
LIEAMPGSYREGEDLHSTSLSDKRSASFRQYPANLRRYVGLPFEIIQL